MANVYVVTSGEYSDYGICAIFSTRELAEEYVAKYNTGGLHFDKAEIEEWKLDGEVGAQVVVCFAAQIDLPTGAITELDRELRFIRSRDHEVRHSLANFDFAYSTQSQEHANELAVEKRERWLRAHPEKRSP